MTKHKEIYVFETDKELFQGTISEAAEYFDMSRELLYYKVSKNKIKRRPLANRPN